MNVKSLLRRDAPGSSLSLPRVLVRSKPVTACSLTFLLLPDSHRSRKSCGKTLNAVTLGCVQGGIRWGLVTGRFQGWCGVWGPSDACWAIFVCSCLLLVQ